MRAFHIFGLVMLLLGFAFTNAVAKAVRPVVRTVETPFAGSLLYVPNDNKPHPGIVILHGSEGGSDVSYRLQAQLLAAQGYASLAYCYFDCDRYLTELRATLKGVELGTVAKAIAWLRQSEFVKNKRVALYGYSRGAEAAEIVATRVTDSASMPDALVLHAATDITTGSSNWDWFDSRCWICKDGKACTFRDPIQERVWSPTCGADSPVDAQFNLRGLKVAAWQWQGGEVLPGLMIPIENYRGPILLTHGTKDEVWSVKKSERLVQRLADVGGKNLQHEFFEGEGHEFGVPAENRRLALIVTFLARNLSH